MRYRDCNPRHESIPIHRDSRGISALGHFAPSNILPIYRHRLECAEGATEISPGLAHSDYPG